jgi:hypothetical protein
MAIKNFQIISKNSRNNIIVPLKKVRSAAGQSGLSFPDFG